MSLDSLLRVKNPGSWKGCVLAREYWISRRQYHNLDAREVTEQKLWVATTPLPPQGTATQTKHPGGSWLLVAGSHRELATTSCRAIAMHSPKGRLSLGLWVTVQKSLFSFVYAQNEIICLCLILNILEERTHERRFPAPSPSFWILLF